MVEYKFILGIITVVLAFVGYGIYFWQVFSGKVKPHAFSWFVWSLTTGIIFFGQVFKGAEAGAWATGAISVACFIIFILALFKGYRDYAFWDWIFLVSAIFSLLLWYIAKEPTLALIFISITDALAILPTLHKVYHKPFEDSVTLFSINAVRSVASLFAFQVYTFASVIYPVKLVLFNAMLVVVMVARRRSQRSNLQV